MSCQQQSSGKCLSICEAGGGGREELNLASISSCFPLVCENKFENFPFETIILVSSVNLKGYQLSFSPIFKISKEQVHLQKLKKIPYHLFIELCHF